VQQRRRAGRQQELRELRQAAVVECQLAQRRKAAEGARRQRAKARA